MWGRKLTYAGTTVFDNDNSVDYCQLLLISFRSFQVRSTEKATKGIQGKASSSPVPLNVWWKSSLMPQTTGTQHDSDQSCLSMYLLVLWANHGFHRVSGKSCPPTDERKLLKCGRRWNRSFWAAHFYHRPDLFSVTRRKKGLNLRSAVRDDFTGWERHFLVLEKKFEAKWGGIYNLRCCLWIPPLFLLVYSALLMF